MAEHNTLTDPELHEPKDISTATVDQVYVADGAGAGAWGTSPGAAANIVDVAALADFPAPTASVITLLDNTIYNVQGNVNIAGNRLVMGLNTQINGNSRFIDGLTYTGTDPMITATAQTFNLREMNFTCATADFFDLTGGGTETLVVTNCFIINCKSVGTLAAWRTTVFRSFSVIGSTTTGLLFTGACVAFNMDNSLWQAFTTGGKMIDFGTATFDRIQILSGNRFVPTTGVTAISGAVTSGNLNAGAFGIIHGNIFEGAGTFLSGLAATDLLWERGANGGIADTIRSATGSVITQSTTTSTSTTPTKINIGTAFVADLQNQFTVDNTGKITYNGKGPIAFQVDATVLFDTGSGSNQVYRFYVAKNGTIVTSSVGEQEIDSTDPIQVTVNGVVTLSATDFVEIFVEKGTSTGTDTARTMNIVVR